MGCNASKPEPGNNIPKAPKAHTVQEAPKPAAEEPKPAAEEQKATSEEPKPAAEEQKTTTEESKPAEEPKASGAVAINDNESDAFGLLLCGAGESGKTTFTRQLKIKFLGGISEEDRKSFVATIRGNLIEAMQTLLVWAERNGLEVSDDLQGEAQDISILNAFDTEFTPEIADSLSKLWEDETVQEAFKHKDQTTVPDHMDYFFGKIDELQDDDYVPSDDDVLRARIRSIGIDAVTFNMDGAYIRIYDVGGQKNERSKWQKVMNDVSGCIFVVSFAEYDKPMFEDPSVLRINDSIEIFKEISRKQEFQESPIFLICNKYDQFVEKVRNTDTFAKTFPEYDGNPNDPDKCAEFLKQKFLDVAGNVPTRPIKVYIQSALDSQQVIDNTNSICQFISANYYD